MNVELRAIAHNKTVGNILHDLDRYVDALGHEPEAHYLTPKQWASVSAALDKFNNDSKRSGDLLGGGAKGVTHKNVPIRVIGG